MEERSAGVMGMVVWRPRAPLSRYVEFFRYVAIPAGFRDELTIVSVPSATTEIVISTSACMSDLPPDGGVVAKPRDFVFGPMGMERGALLRGGDEVRVLSLVLRPGVLFHVSRVSVSQLRDAVVPALDLVPRAILDALRAAISRDDAEPPRLDIEQIAARLFEDADLPDLRVRSALAGLSSPASIDEAMAAAGLSARHAERLFARLVGLTPKQLQRLTRFRSVAKRLAFAPSATTTLAELAASLGYADHAHMTRDFRAFTGTTPSAYAAKRTSALYLEPVEEDGGDVQATLRRSA